MTELSHNVLMVSSPIRPIPRPFFSSAPLEDTHATSVEPTVRAVVDATHPFEVATVRLALALAPRLEVSRVRSVVRHEPRAVAVGDGHEARLATPRGRHRVAVFGVENLGPVLVRF